MASTPQPYLTFEAYLEQERASDQKHEYVNGRIVAMAGGTPAHAYITANVIGALSRALGDSGNCRAFSPDLRIQVDKKHTYYADVSVICGQPAYVPGTTDVVTNPVLVVEVISPSTESRDRGEKLRQYRQLPSVRHILVIAQNAIDVEHYIRLDDGAWRLETLTSLTNQIHLSALNCVITLTAIYKDVEALQQPA